MEAESVSSILDVISNWADEIGTYALALVAVGALSMALLEAVKGIFKVRASYHERSLKRWLREVLTEYLDPEALAASEVLKDTCTSPVSLADEGIRQVVSLATGVPPEKVKAESSPYSVFSISPERSLYTLPLDKMMGQIQESTEIILDNPHLYKPAFILLSSTANKQDVEDWFSARNPDQIAIDNLPDLQRTKDIARVGNRIQQSVQRQLDTFQLRTDYLWARWNQIASFLIGAVVLFAAIYYSRSLGTTGGTSIKDIPEILLLSLLGGFTAPVAKDLVTNLRKVKARE